MCNALLYIAVLHFDIHQVALAICALCADWSRYSCIVTNIWVRKETFYAVQNSWGCHKQQGNKHKVCRNMLWRLVCSFHCNIKWDFFLKCLDISQLLIVIIRCKKYLSLLRMDKSLKLIIMHYCSLFFLYTFYTSW